MKPKPKRLSPEQRRDRRLHYQHLRKQDLRPFVGAKLAPWEQRLLARSLKIVSETTVGLHRKADETARTVRKIVPLSVKAVKPAMKGKIPEKDYEIFCKLMDWYAENPREFGEYLQKPPKEIMGLGKRLSFQSHMKILATLARTFFRHKNIERPEQIYMIPRKTLNSG